MNEKTLDLGPGPPGGNSAGNSPPSLTLSVLRPAIHLHDAGRGGSSRATRSSSCAPDAVKPAARRAICDDDTMAHGSAH